MGLDETPVLVDEGPSPAIKRSLRELIYAYCADDYSFSIRGVLALFSTGFCFGVAGVSDEYSPSSGLGWCPVTASIIDLARAYASRAGSEWVILIDRNPMNTRTLAAALAGATLFGLTAAQAAPKPKLKANPAGAVTVTTVVVTNSRKADLVELQAAESGSADWKEVLGPLKSGKQASAKLPQASDCRFDLRGTFDDGQSMDASGVNVCADKTLNLTD
jgi:hypothetical protein